MSSAIANIIFLKFRDNVLRRNFGLALVTPRTKGDIRAELFLFLYLSFVFADIMQ